jgi:uncharacterized protein YjiS (DUF1127 family)
MTTRVLWHPAHLHAGALGAPVASGRAAPFRHIGSTLRSWRRRLRERDQLARLDERMLADIGITRADAEFLINKPFWKE